MQGLRDREAKEKVRKEREGDEEKRRGKSGADGRERLIGRIGEKEREGKETERE